MIREIDTSDFDFKEKVLVCITAQSNSKRLIDAGAAVNYISSMFKKVILYLMTVKH